MSLEDLIEQFTAAATPELAKLATQYAPVAEHAIEAGAGAAAGAATAEFAKLKAYAEELGKTLVAHHEFLAKLIPALAAHGIGTDVLPTAPAAAPVLTTVPVEGQEQKPEVAG